MRLKRTGSEVQDQPLRRLKPTPVMITPFKITNLADGETVHQTCLIVTGECHAVENSEEDFVSVVCTDGIIQHRHITHWPIANGHWKALVMLSSGINELTFELHQEGSFPSTLKLQVIYQPLLQVPPLHLAILVARDSPLLMDCPPGKYGGISSAHSSLDAAIAKLRVSAYMWQALTAEDMRKKGLGRRSFRLEEEWSPNTTAWKAHCFAPGASTHMGSVAKVHIIRSERTVAQLRDVNCAQQNPKASRADALHQYFESALKAQGAPFNSSCHPVVAGMILDAHYSVEQDVILGHAALGCHKPDGISLGIFGSHLAYSWPRFMEEIPTCLLDRTATGDTVGNDNGECGTMRGACFVGQGAFLHEVGHAFGAQHTTGIMARGYSKHWDRNFLGHSEAENDATWDLQDVLQFKLLPHFRLPGDEPISKQFAQADVRAEAFTDDDNEEALRIRCSAGLARIKIWNGENSRCSHLLDRPGLSTECLIYPAQAGYVDTLPLKVAALGMNGRERVVRDVWRLLNEKPYIKIPESDIVLRKQSVKSAELEKADEQSHEEQYHPWAMLLQERGEDGKLHRATAIDLRVGCTMDGAVVYYADGHHTNCGPVTKHRFGGHASEKRDLPENATIMKVELCRRQEGWGSLAGIRMTLNNGATWGELNNDGVRSQVVTLQPAEDERVVGFFGQSDMEFGFTYEFGILTMPKDAVLPDHAYDMRELRNVVDNDGNDGNDDSDDSDNSDNSGDI